MIYIIYIYKFRSLIDCLLQFEPYQVIPSHLNSNQITQFTPVPGLVNHLSFIQLHVNNSLYTVPVQSGCFDKYTVVELGNFGIVRISIHPYNLVLHLKLESENIFPLKWKCFPYVSQSYILLSNVNPTLYTNCNTQRRQDSQDHRYLMECNSTQDRSSEPSWN